MERNRYSSQLGCLYARKAKGNVPLSLANDQTILPADAINAIVPSQAVKISVKVMAELAAREPVILLKISIIGKPVGLSIAVSMSPIQNRTANKNAKPIVPLIATGLSMHCGMTTAGFCISSPR